MYVYVWPSQLALVVKNLPANTQDVSSIPGLGRSPEEEHGNPLQYHCLENPMDRGAWQATVHRVTQSQTRLKQLGMHAGMFMCIFMHSYMYTCIHIAIYTVCNTSLRGLYPYLYL